MQPKKPRHHPVRAKRGSARANQEHDEPSGKRLETVANPFADLAVSDSFKQALHEHLQFDRLTEVQSKTLPVISSGKDVLAKARTGTGKTIAFLLNPLDGLVTKPLPMRTQGAIAMLVLSPTRELAQQIADEAKGLLHFCPPHSCNVQVMVGGTPMKKDVSKLRQIASQPIDLLVCTPGRLETHLRETFADRNEIDKVFGSLRFLVLDEADRLLDQGFRDAILSIVSYLPKTRQTLLFSATVPPAMKSLLQESLKSDHVLVDTVGDHEQEQTSAQVEQFAIAQIPFRAQIQMLDHILQRHILTENPQQYKIICFFPTARAADFAFKLFSEDPRMPNQCIVLHSRMSQSARQKSSDKFRDETQRILFSSDVSARGLDYPNVSLVVQCGIVDKEQYIHRVGRTARAGENGKAILLLTEHETFVLTKTLAGLPITSLAIPTEGLVTSKELERNLNRVRAEGSELETCAKQAYAAYLGFHKAQLKNLRLNATQLVDLANDYALNVLGLSEIPTLEKKLVAKMGLQNVPGIKVQQTPVHHNGERPAPQQQRKPHEGNGSIRGSHGQGQRGSRRGGGGRGRGQ